MCKRSVRIYTSALTRKVEDVWLYSLVCVGPDRKRRRPVHLKQPNFNKYSKYSQRVPVGVISSNSFFIFAKDIDRGYS